MPIRHDHSEHPELGRTLAERAYYLIREKILTGKIPLGTPISRRRVADELGMSFLPISQALERLEYEELVESRPRVGTRVRVPMPRDVREHYILREALECQAARLFAEKASSEERLELRKMARRVDQMLKAHDKKADAGAVFRAQSYHVSFHMRIVECTGSASLRKAIENAHVLTFNWLYDIIAKLSLPPRWHGELMEALSGKNPEVAERAMRRHINYGLRQIQETLVQQLGPIVPRFGRIKPLPSERTLKAAPGEWRLRTNR
jgi:DNA-binding GntR family transcriptional regulator